MSIRIVTTGLLLAGLFTLSAVDSQAAGRHRTGNVAGPGGRSAVLQKDVARGGGQASISSSVQGSDGQGVTRTVNGDYDQATGSYTRNGNVTTNGGRSANTSVNSTRTDNGRTTSAGVTGSNGGSASVTGSTDCTDNSCTHTSQRSVTTPNGQTYGGSSSVSVSKNGGH